MTTKLHENSGFPNVHEWKKFFFRGNVHENSAIFHVRAILQACAIPQVHAKWKKANLLFCSIFFTFVGIKITFVCCQ
jgi:hypothetical protein